MTNSIQYSHIPCGNEEVSASESMTSMQLPYAVVTRASGAALHSLCVSNHESLLVPLEPMTIGFSNENGDFCERHLRAYSLSRFAAGQLCNAVGSDDDELLLLQIDPDWFTAVWHRINAVSEPPCTPMIDTVHADIPLLGSAIARLFAAEDGSSKTFLPPILDWLVSRCVCQLGTQAPEASPISLGDAELRQTLLEIEKRLPDAVPVSQLAQTLGMSNSRYSRAFKASIGCPPSRYVLERRVAQARRLLETTTMSLIEVTLESGFSSQSHMTFVFVKELGITPGQYRRSCRGSHIPREVAETIR